jgi:hypothetical protein
MLAQYTAEFVRLYPNAAVLMAGKEDLEGDRRRELVSRIATGDWDAVVITHSSFERIRMSPQFTQIHQGIIMEIEMAVRAERSNDRGNRIVKQLEAMKKNWTVRLEKLLADKKKDDLLTWEQLGIDCLFVDEAHLFKNLYRFTKMTRVAGLPLTNSERAFDLFLKTRYTMRHAHGGAQRGVVFATATPVANTMAEIHTMMRYLQPRRLEELGLQQFDAWAATFGESVTALEIAPDGSGYRMHTRFARFINVPELMAVFGEVADIRTAEMLKLPVPRLRGDKPRIVACPASPALKAFVQTLVERAEAIRSGHVKPQDDNMLAITTDGRKAALDFRLVAPSARFDEQRQGGCLRARGAGDLATHRRIPRCAAGVLRPVVTEGRHGLQRLRRPEARLMEAGVPRRRSRSCMTPRPTPRRQRCSRQCATGRVRVLLGSTAKMGIGTNVQTRLARCTTWTRPGVPATSNNAKGASCARATSARTWRSSATSPKAVSIQLHVADLGDQGALHRPGDERRQGLRSLEDVELAALSYAEVKAFRPRATRCSRDREGRRGCRGGQAGAHRRLFSVEVAQPALRGIARQRERGEQLVGCRWASRRHAATR